MKQIMILSTIFLYLGLIPSCSTPPIEDSCKTGTNSKIWHKCINQSLDKKGSLLLDLNDDTKPDFGISMEKEIQNGSTIYSVGYLSFLNPIQARSGGLRFDYFVEKVKYISDTDYIYAPKILLEGYIIDSSLYNWILRLNQNLPNLILFHTTDLTTLGNPFKIVHGPLDKGDFYIAFRYYETDKEPKGWKNGWLKMNVTKEKYTLLEVAYNKIPETKIKVGEK